MLKLGKFGIALALALMMSLALLTSGVFAQSTQTSHNSSAHPAAVTTILQDVQQTSQTNQARQTTQKLDWGPGGDGWGHRFHHHRFFHPRFFFFFFFHHHFRCW